ncbi:MAG: 50S ribosomal protein L22 [Phycisphaerae bacterium]|jgi:large subunit ribosomal protein L22|nr:50S ribosomal protein L22 [Phycisphaerae bacterium]|tara:strand:- start:3959 stop:4291 length:333 start_codon:yes stop_codon:yes gene_type:complete
MTYKAIHKYARISPRKARLIADLIRGKRIDVALSQLEFSKKRAAWYFKSVLNSAIANAEEQNADVSTLYVSESRVDEGSVIKRWRPKDRGRAHPIHKPTSHLIISVGEKK